MAKIDKKIFPLFFTIFSFIFLSVFFVSCNIGWAQTGVFTENPDMSWVNVAQESGYSVTDPGYDRAVKLIGDIIRFILTFLGAVFFILIIYGGFLWLTAGGNEEKLTKAKSLLINAVIGLIIVFAAYAIIYLVLNVLAVPGGTGTGGENINGKFPWE